MTRVNRDEQKELDKKFQKAYKHWIEYEDETSWKCIWYMVQFCISNSVKAQLKGVKRDDFEDLVLDATIRLMERIKRWKEKGKTYKIDYLPAVTQLEATYILRNKKQKQIDSEYSLEELEERFYVKESYLNKD